MSMDELPSCDEEVCSVFDEEQDRASAILVAKNLDLPELQGDPEEVDTAAGWPAADGKL